MICLIKMGQVSNRILYLLLLYLINSVRHGTAIGQTVTMEDGIPAEKSTTSAMIIKAENIVQYVEKDIHEYNYCCIKYCCSAALILLH